MYKVTLIIAFLFVVTLGFSQESSQDVVYTKGGSVFRGEIVKIDDDRSIDLKIKNGQIVHFDIAEIEKTIQESNEQKQDKPYKFKEKGLFFASSFCPTFGSSSWGNPIMGMGLHQVIGIQKNRWLGVGLGFGIDNYELSERSFVPLYLEVRGYFTENNVSPYYAVDFGYGFAKDRREGIEKETKGGRYFYPAVGYRFGAKKGGNFTLDFGLKFQKGTFTRDWGRRTETRDVDFRRFAFRLGWLF